MQSVKQCSLSNDLAIEPGLGIGFESRPLPQDQDLQKLYSSVALET